MRVARSRRRQKFLTDMSKEAVACYRDPYREWYDDERQLMPHFLSLVGPKMRILDLAGGYAKAAPVLLGGGNEVVLADLSEESLRTGREENAATDLQIVRLDMLNEFPFVDGAFDGVWFAEAFEYVPPDERSTFLKSLRRLVKKDGVVFLNTEGLNEELSIFAYLKNYLYWKLVKRAPVIWGEYIFKVDLPLYKGWHYHSLVLSRGIGKSFSEAGFDILKSTEYGKGDYTSFVLRAI